MTTDLVPRHVVQPATGEKFSLDSPSEQLASALWEVRDIEQRLRAFKQQVGQELNTRLDKSGKWTAREGDYEVRGESPEPKVDYHGEELYNALARLVQAELITPAAAEAALERVVTFKPKKAGIKALLKRHGEVRDAIEACSYVDHEYQRRAPSVRRRA